MQKINRQNGDNSVQERNGRIGHGNTGEFGDEERNDQFKGLHFSDLPFSHQPHDDEQRYENDDCSDENQTHIGSISEKFPFMYFLPFKRLQKSEGGIIIYPRLRVALGA